MGLAHVIFKRIRNAARYVGRYFGQKYLDASRAFWIGGVPEQHKFAQHPLSEILDFLLNGALPDGRAVQNAWRDEPDKAGRMPVRIDEATVSLAKCLSVAFVVLKNHREALHEIFHESVRALFAALEDDAALARKGKASEYVKGRWAALVIPEYTNRNGDIQVHFHVLIFTVLECEDGVVRALDNRPLFERARWAGKLLTAELTKRLTALGLTIERKADGKLSIAGIPEDLCDDWSSRRPEVLAYMEAKGLTTPKQSDWAAKASRTEEKDRTEDLPDVLLRHEHKAESRGHDLSKIEALCFGNEKRRELNPGLARTVISEIVTQAKERERIRSLDIEAAFADRAPELGFGIRETIDFVRDAIRNLPNVVHSYWQHRAQMRVDHAAQRLFDRRGVESSTRKTDRAALRHDLSDKERESVRSLTAGDSAIRVLDGNDSERRYAVIRAISDAFSRSGIDCVAVTLRRREAVALGETVDIPVFTVAKAQLEWKRAKSLLHADRNRFRRIHTDAVQDTIAWAIGLRSYKEVAWRSWMRQREPLDLRAGRHCLIIEEAQNLSNRLLGAVLTEAKAAGATVLLSGNSLKSSRFADLVKDCQSASLQLDPYEQQLERAPELRRFLEELDFELGRSRLERGEEGITQ